MDKRKIAFFHMNQLGDLLFSLPVLAAARKAWPESERVSVVRSSLAPLLEASGLVSGAVTKTGNSLGDRFRLVRSLSRYGFSDAVLFSESPDTLLTCYAAGIPQRSGFETASLRFLLTRTVPRAGVPSLANNRRLGDALGLSAIPKDYTGLLLVPEKHKAHVRQWMFKEELNPAKVVIVAPGASKRRREKCWKNDRWASLLSLLAKHRACPVLVGAPEEKDALLMLAAQVHSSEKPRVYPAEGGILALAALMTQAKAFIGIDSGAMHLAACLGLSCTVLIGPTDPSQIGPQPLDKHRVVKRGSMDAITVEDAWEGLSSLL
jgi:ADP-heptose:LPS heptosyltransferase